MVAVFEGGWTMRTIVTLGATLGATLGLPLAGLLLLSACQRATSTSTPSIPQTSSITTASTNSNAVQPTVPGKSIAGETARIDACALLTSSEIADIQKESVKELKLSGTSDSGFDISQCFYTLPTFANSVSLKVTQKSISSGAHDPREFWRATFHEDERRNEDDRERVREQARERFESEDEESAPPLPVTGIGDEAFWMGDQVGGALYVLKGNNYLRISVGGAGDRKAKIEKSTALAKKALDRLGS